MLTNLKCLNCTFQLIAEGRIRVEELGAPHLIASFLENTNPSNTKRLRMGLGCIANLVANTDHLILQMAHLIPSFVQCSAHPQPEISSMALLALTNVLSDEQAVASAINAGAMDVMIKKLRSPDPNDISQLCEALGALVSDNTFASIFIKEHKGLSILIDLLAQQVKLDIDADADELDLEEARDDANATVKAVIGVLHGIAESGDEGRGYFLTEDRKILNYLLALFSGEGIPSWSNLPEESSKVLAYLSLSTDINRQVLFEQAHLLKKCLSDHKTEGTAERRMSAAMILGNLAEDEATASKLIAMGVNSALCDELFRGLDMNSGSTHEESANIAEAAQNSEKEGKEMRIKHLCCKGLKNLAIHPDHKVALIKHGIIASLVALLKQRNQVVADAALGLLKSLLISEASIEPFLAADPGASTILELTSTDEENKKDDHLLYESSRTVSMLAIRHPTLFEAYMPEPSAEAAQQLSKIDGKRFLSPFTAIANLLHSKFAILQNEGATVLAAMLQKFPNSALPISKVPGLIERVILLLKPKATGQPLEETIVPQEGLDTSAQLSQLLKLLLDSNNEFVRSVVSSKVKEAPEGVKELLISKPETGLTELAASLKSVM